MKALKIAAIITACLVTAALGACFGVFVLGVVIKLFSLAGV